MDGDDSRGMDDDEISSVGLRQRHPTSISQFVSQSFSQSESPTIPVYTAEESISPSSTMPSSHVESLPTTPHGSDAPLPPPPNLAPNARIRLFQDSFNYVAFLQCCSVLYAIFEFSFHMEDELKKNTQKFRYFSLPPFTDHSLFRCCILAITRTLHHSWPGLVGFAYLVHFLAIFIRFICHLIFIRGTSGWQLSWENLKGSETSGVVMFVAVACGTTFGDDDSKTSLSSSKVMTDIGRIGGRRAEHEAEQISQFFLLTGLLFFVLSEILHATVDMSSKALMGLVMAVASTNISTSRSTSLARDRSAEHEQAATEGDFPDAQTTSSSDPISSPFPPPLSQPPPPLSPSLPLPPPPRSPSLPSLQQSRGTSSRTLYEKLWLGCIHLRALALSFALVWISSKCLLLVYETLSWEDSSVFIFMLSLMSICLEITTRIMVGIAVYGLSLYRELYSSSLSSRSALFYEDFEWWIRAGGSFVSACNSLIAFIAMTSFLFYSEDGGAVSSMVLWSVQLFVSVILPARQSWEKFCERRRVGTAMRSVPARSLTRSAESCIICMGMLHAQNSSTSSAVTSADDEGDLDKKNSDGSSHRTSSGETEIEDVVVTNCGHYFHRRCLVLWANVRFTCPTCQQGLDSAQDTHRQNEMSYPVIVQ